VALGGTRGSGGAAEVAVGEDAVPELAHEGGAEEVRGLVRWDAEEDLLNELLRQRRKRRARTVARRRRHVVGCLSIRRFSCAQHSTALKLKVKPARRRLNNRAGQAGTGNLV
jgi:hypothetical protein